MKLSKYKLVRGIQKILAGQTLDFVIGLRERRRERAMAAFQKSDKTEICWPIERGVRMMLNRHASLTEMIMKNQFENGERALLGQLLKPGDFFVDVGANIGFFTVLAAKMVGASGKVVAIEPSPITCSRLKSQIKVNTFKNISVFECGVSSSNGQLTFMQSLEDADAYNSFGTPLMNGQYEKIEVPVRTLTEIITESCGSRTPKIIKIDVEGWELQVLKGAKEILDRPDAPMLMIELSEKTLNGAGTSSKELVDLLTSHRYQLQKIDQHNGSLSPLSESQDFEYANVLAVKNGSI